MIDYIFDDWLQIDDWLKIHPTAWSAEIDDVFYL